VGKRSRGLLSQHSLGRTEISNKTAATRPGFKPNSF
jgi:hypothetical protein